MFFSFHIQSSLHFILLSHITKPKTAGLESKKSWVYVKESYRDASKHVGQTKRR